MCTTSPEPDSSSPEVRTFRYNIRSMLALKLVVALSMSLIGVLIPACSPRYYINPLVRVAGIVLVDGKAEAGVKVIPEPTPADPPGATISRGITDVKGYFELSTYDHRDGVPRGEYKLTFTWPDSAGNDRLHGRYAKTAGNLKTFTARWDPVNLGTISLTTK